MEMIQIFINLTSSSKKMDKKLLYINYSLPLKNSQIRIKLKIKSVNS